MQMQMQRSSAAARQAARLPAAAPVLLMPRSCACARSVAPSQRPRVVLASAAEPATTTTTTTTPPASAPAGGAAPPAGALLELNKDTFSEYLESAGDALVVVDFFTDWCGPCKLIYPQLVAMSAELAPRATIVKFNCNQYNKELAKSLGIKVAPTFHLYRGGQRVADMTGAKVDKLRSLIEEHLQPAAEAAAADGQN